MLIQAFTDGSCLSNGEDNAVGGYGAVLSFIFQGEVRTKEVSGSITNTTNNRAELTAVIKAMESVKGSHDWKFTLDSKYVIDIAEGNKNPKLNLDLWKRYQDLRSMHKSVSFFWVGGHTGDVLNERCNLLAQTAANQQAMFMARQASALEVKQEIIEDIVAKKKQLSFLQRLFGGKE